MFISLKFNGTFNHQSPTFALEIKSFHNLTHILTVISFSAFPTDAPVMVVIPLCVVFFFLRGRYFVLSPDYPTTISLSDVRTRK